jgi:outer membrane translocation and assembly module TamA
VIALNYWTSYSPTWDEQPDGAIDNRPPSYTGSTLGGLWRMRGFPTQRFNDMAAVYYAAELRLIPRWNPFERWNWIQQYVGIQWLQFVPFVEIGRVAPEWNIRRLHSDMKWDAGIGIRAWAKGIVARIDTAYSDEGFGVQMMISQPFQF